MVWNQEILQQIVEKRYGGNVAKVMSGKRELPIETKEQDVHIVRAEKRTIKVNALKYKSKTTFVFRSIYISLVSKLVNIERFLCMWVGGKFDFGFV